jgi:hypothetical protein
LNHLHADTGRINLMGRMVVLGLSLGLTMPVFNIAVQSAFDRTHLGVVTASTQLFRSVGGTVGIALLGVIFSNTLADKAATLASTNFAQSARQQMDVTDPNVLQGLMMPTSQDKLTASLQHLPAPAQAIAMHNFEVFINAARIDFTESVAHVFLISYLLALAAFGVTIFLKEVPLHASKKPADKLAEAGEELAIELGQAEAKDEPVLTPSK